MQGGKDGRRHSCSTHGAFIAHLEVFGIIPAVVMAIVLRRKTSPDAKIKTSRVRDKQKAENLLRPEGRTGQVSTQPKVKGQPYQKRTIMNGDVKATCGDFPQKETNTCKMVHGDGR